MVYIFQWYFKNMIFCEYVKFGVILWKFDILLITCLIKVQILKSFCTYVTHLIVIICRTSHFVSTWIDFQLTTDFPSQFCVFNRKVT